MKILKSIIAVFLVVAIVFISFVPAFAVDPGLIVDGAAIAPSFFDWVVGSLQSFGNWANSYFIEDVCRGAGATENSRHIFEPMYTTVNGKLGNYYICKNCGLSAGEVSEPAYQEQVSELPAQGYTSEGGLIFPLEVACHKAVTSYSSSWSRADWLFCDNHTLSSKKYSSFTIHFSCESNSVSYSLNSGYSDFVNPGLEYYVSFTAPYDGYYSFLCPPVSISYVTSSGVQGSKIGSGSLNFSSPVYYETGYNRDNFDYRYVLLPDSLKIFSATATFETPVAKFTPAPSVDPDYQSQYGTDTRPTVITGDYGIVDNQGVATVIKDCTIVNETTNNYYNPATGQNYPIKDWSYDYPSREYTITTDSNNTVTITYGDENVTIQEGDTIYNIYYVVDGFGEEKPPCAHDWQKGTRTDPTCSEPGLQIYTCSKCGEQKSETIPTTAHDWKADAKTDPTCTQPGRQPYTCNNCGGTKSDTIPALGHNWQVKQSALPLSACPAPPTGAPAPAAPRRTG